MSINGLSSNYSFNQQRMNPDDYAQQYANQNGLSLEEAKAELKSKYGDPSQGMNASSVFGSNNNFETNNSFGSDYNIGSNFNSQQRIEIDPDEYAQVYADMYNVSLADAKAALEEQFGTPSQGTQIPGLDKFNSSFSTTINTDNNSTNDNGIQSALQDILNRIMNLLKGPAGPQNEGDPVNEEDNVNIFA